MNDWLTRAEIGDAPGMPFGGGSLKRWCSRNGVIRRPRTTGKGYEYRFDSLPMETQAYLARRERPHPKITPIADAEPARRPSRVINSARKRSHVDGAALWDWAERQDDARRAIGAERAALVREVVAMIGAGESRDAAIASVAGAHSDITAASLRRWYLLAMRHERADWAAALIPHKRGRRSGNGRTDIHPDAWAWFRSQWLTRRQPTVAEVYRRLGDIAEKHGWAPLASESTFARRVAELPTHTVTYHREGPEALAALIPRIRRDNSVYAPGEAVNGDGLKLDKLWVKWPDGEIINTTTMWPWQDLRTGRILAWRIAKTESTDLFRLATYDLTAVTLPRYAWLDNTRVAANLAMTGQAAGRHRFAGPRRAEDPLGILVQLGIEPHFTDPKKEYALMGSVLDFVRVDGVGA